MPDHTRLDYFSDAPLGALGRVAALGALVELRLSNIVRSWGGQPEDEGQLMDHLYKRFKEIKAERQAAGLSTPDGLSEAVTAARRVMRKRNALLHSMWPSETTGWRNRPSGPVPTEAAGIDSVREVIDELVATVEALGQYLYSPIDVATIDEATVIEGWRQDVLEFADDVWMLSARRQVFLELDRELEREGSQSAAWFRRNVLRPLYGDAQAVAVRRLVDGHRRSKSFVRLLDEMIKHPSLLSRKRYLELIAARRTGGEEADEVGLANSLFDDLAGVATDHVSVERLRELRSVLIADGERVKAHVDQYVAHRDRSPDFDPATWDDLNIAIDRMATALGQVGRLVDGILRFGDPTFQFDWSGFLQRGLFRRPIHDPQLLIPGYSPPSFS